ncbi:hypothetical protein LINPERPRIM_LOCUS40569 [Linum perenne]
MLMFLWLLTWCFLLVKGTHLVTSNVSDFPQAHDHNHA